jgi:GLPGLI family protein
MILMKKLLLLTVFTIYTYSYAQNKGIVYYGHIESPGKGGPNGLDFNSYLIFDQNQSYYVSAKDSLENESNIESQKKKKAEGEIKQIYLGKHTLEQGKQVYYDRTKDSLWWNKKYSNEIYGKEKRVAIEWKIDPETKKIGNLLCNKATGHFRGRDYTVWFTKEIPVPFGPWKLQGLPGLILEAYDTKKELYIYFKSLEYPSKNVSVPKIKPINQGTPTNWVSIDEYKMILEKLIEKNKNKAILLGKEHGVTIKAAGMNDISTEIF